MELIDKATRVVRPRARRAVRRGMKAGHGAATRAAVTAKRLPLPARLRAWLYQFLPWRPRRFDVPIEMLLLGGQNRVSAADYAAGTDNLLWPSTRVVDGPHAALLRAASAGPLTDAEILASPYAEMARACIQMSGQFFAATDDAGIVVEARGFIARREQVTAPVVDRPHQSGPRSPIRVARVRASDCFQVIDGHHRIALAAVNGEATVRVQCKWFAVSTPLQDILNRMSWIGGETELYQPVSAPELAKSWTIVRRCTDRLAKMLDFTAELGLEPARSSYLDVASCYGWFVSEMGRAGFDARGVERDPLGPVLGKAVYGLDPARVTTGDAVDFLRAGQRHDVVSCLSLLHHFALGRGVVSAEEFVRLLDGATGRVLFLDTGQQHEQWFENSLSEWDTDYVRKFLLANSTFDDVIDLGPDIDAVVPYEKNYGRHFFACVRNQA